MAITKNNTRMLEGEISKANLFASNNSSQALSATTWTDVVLANDSLDTANAFANNTFTPPVTGYYCIQGAVSVECSDANDMSYLGVRLTKGGSAIAGTEHFLSETHAQGGSNTNFSSASANTFVIAYLTPSDTIKMQVYANAGVGNLSVSNSASSLGIFQIA
jgi:hypothetical protein